MTLDQKLADAQKAYDAFAESRCAAGQGKRDQQILAPYFNLSISLDINGGNGSMLASAQLIYLIGFQDEDV